MVSRNDDHGGGMHRRMLAFLEGLYRQAALFPFSAEIVMVEWNPPADTPGLATVLPKPPKGTSLQLRVVTVPASIHQQYKSSAFLGLHQMIGKNVGIRRARGKFVLCTNVDILFSDALIQFFCQEKLDPKAIYRANRCDVPAQVAEMADAGERLVFCAKNVFQVFGLDASRPFLLGDMLTQNRDKPIKSWFLNLLAGVGQWVFQLDGYHVARLDLWACGDFTLMAKSGWEKIEGYAELDTYPAHIDSLAVASAVAAGMKQVVLPKQLCGYHIDHSSGYETGNPEEMIKRMEKRPGPDYGVVYIAMQRMLKRREPLRVNGADWGWEKEVFEELLIVND